MVGTIQITFSAKKPQGFGNIEILKKNFKSWRDCEGDEDLEIVLGHFEPITRKSGNVILPRTICHKRTTKFYFLLYRDSGNSITALISPLENVEVASYVSLANKYLNYIAKQLKLSLVRVNRRLRYSDVSCIVRPKGYRELHLCYERRRTKLPRIFFGYSIISILVAAPVSVLMFTFNFSYLLGKNDNVDNAVYLKAFSISAATGFIMSLVASAIVLILRFTVYLPKEFSQKPI